MTTPRNDDDDSLKWMEQAACDRPENRDLQEKFFSPQLAERYAAKNLCYSCDVRKECLTYALENSIIWGVWGGKDSNDIRRTLSVNYQGNESRRTRFPQCPWCGERTSRLKVKTVSVPGGGRWNTARAVECTACGFEWKSRSSSNAVKAYFADRAIREERAQKVRDAVRKKREALQRRQERAGGHRAKQLPSTGMPPKSSDSATE